jgi:ribonuclease R
MNKLALNKSYKAELRDTLNELINEGKIVKLGKYYSMPNATREIQEEEHSKVQLTGNLKQVGNFLYVMPENKGYRKDIFIPRKRAMNAKPGDKVVCEILHEDDFEPEGRILEVIGKAGTEKVEEISVLKKYGFEIDFPKEIEDEAITIEKEKSIEPEDVNSAINFLGKKRKLTLSMVWDYLKDKRSTTERLDLSDLICFTIDPEDAKDFDDAVSFEKAPDGYLLGVHIADVSHYVKEGSPLDKEAYKRGTSVYLIDTVAPMLPHILSDGLCSLQEGKKRFAFTVIVKLNQNFKAENFKLFKSVIKSKRRFTYDEVQKIIDTQKGDFSKEILMMNEAAKNITERRVSEASIDFESKEIKFVLNKKGKVKDIILKERLDSMRLVEEFMLIANRAVTEYMHYLGDRHQTRYPFIYRVHDLPDKDKLKELSVFIKQFGYNIDLMNKNEIRKLTRAIKGKPEEYVINSLLIRSMAKAIYTTDNIGHYGLGFPNYTHFTSPIRRYPDLIVHRMLFAYMNSQKNPNSVKMHFEKNLTEICKHSSAQEQSAVSAERDMIKIKQIEFLKSHIGDEYEGIISGIMKFGMFVEINDFLAEGMVRYKDIPDDYYEFDERRLCAIGRRRKKMYRAGQTVKVKIINADLSTHKIDFVLV